MNSMVYLVVMTLKNRFLELKKKPAMLFLYIVIIASFVLIVFTSSSNSTGMKDISLLKSIYFGLLAIFFYLGVSKGLSTGGSFFEMCDVNFLFVSPISPRYILVFGIVKQTSMLLLSGIFILCQAQTLTTIFGIGIGGVILIFAGFVLNAIICEALALFIYSYTNNSIFGKNIVKIVAVIIFVPILFRSLLAYLNGTSLAQAVVTAVDSSLIYFVPITGWISQSIISFIAGDFLLAILLLGLTVVLVILLITLVIMDKSDYYEDVLCATETVFQKKAARLEGNLNGMAVTNRKIKVKDTGIKGSGARALFGKHLRENMRGNRFVIIDTSSLMYAVLSGAFAFFLSKNNMIIMLLGFSMYLQIFLIGTGLGLKELFSHYIFMIPENSFAKIFWSNLEVVFKTLIESILMFCIAGVILGESPLMIIGCIAVRTLFSLVLVAINLLSMRIFADTLNRGLLLTFYILFVILVMLPGLVGAIIIGVIFADGQGLLLALGIIALWEVLVAIVCMFLARGVLSDCDMCTAIRKQ